MRVPFTNTKDHAVYIGAIKINPGETRMVEQAHTPNGEAATPAAAQAPEEDTVALLVAKNIPDIVDALPKLGRADVERLAALDAADRNRKGVAEACALRLLEIDDQEQLAAEEARQAAEDAARKAGSSETA